MGRRRVAMDDLNKLALQILLLVWLRRCVIALVVGIIIFVVLKLFRVL